MKKILLGFAVLSLVVLLTACGMTGTIGTFSLDTDEDVFSVAAISSIELLGTQMATETTTVQSSRIQKMDQASVELTLDEVQPYIEIFEQLLAEQNGLSVLVEASDLPEYETKQTFTVSNITDGQITYVMYYNEFLEVDDDDEDEDEQEYRLEGIMIVGDVTYNFVGEREVEDDESELKFKAYIDENNYVEMKYELESDETKFEFERVVNGVTVEESEIKIENEDDEFKIELSIYSDNQESYYEFKLEEEDGQNVLKIEFETTVDGVRTEGEIEVYVIVDALTGETSYQLIVSEGEESYERSFERDLDDKEDEDEDDDDEDDDEDDEDDEDDDEDDEEAEDNDETEDDDQIES